MSNEAWAALAIPVLISIGSAIYAFHTRSVARIEAGVDENHDALEKHNRETDERMDGLAERLARIEVALKHVPTSESMGNLHRRLDEMSGTLRELQGGTAATDRIIGIILQRAFQDAAALKTS